LTFKKQPNKVDLKERLSLEKKKQEQLSEFNKKTEQDWQEMRQQEYRTIDRQINS
jgi:hypothetical protein